MTLPRARILGLGATLCFGLVLALLRVPGTPAFVSEVEVLESVANPMNVALDGGPPDIGAYSGAISADGRFVVFESGAALLVRNDRNGYGDVFLRDRVLGTTELISIATDGTQTDGYSSAPAVSDDGRFVAFESLATNLIEGGTPPGQQNVYLRDRSTGTTVRVSTTTSSEVEGSSGTAIVSGDGRFVAFVSGAEDLVPGDSNALADVFRFDRVSGLIELVSRQPSGEQFAFPSDVVAVSADGQTILFRASVVRPGTDSDPFHDPQGFVRDMEAGTTELVSVDADGLAARGPAYPADMSADGRFVVFWTGAANMPGSSPDGRNMVYVRDRLAATTERATGDSGGDGGAISDDGRYVAYARTILWPPVGAADDLPTLVGMRDRENGTVYGLTVRGFAGEALQLSGRLMLSGDGSDLLATVSWPIAFGPLGTTRPDVVVVRTAASPPLAHRTIVPGVGRAVPELALGELLAARLSPSSHVVAIDFRHAASDGPSPVQWLRLEAPVAGIDPLFLSIPWAEGRGFFELPTEGAEHEFGHLNACLVTGFDDAEPPLCRSYEVAIE